MSKTLKFSAAKVLRVPGTKWACVGCGNIATSFKEKGGRKNVVIGADGAIGTAVCNKCALIMTAHVDGRMTRINPKEILAHPQVNRIKRLHDSIVNELIG